MATAAQITQVRVNTQELANVEPYTDDFIGDLIDAGGTDHAEQVIWTSKRNTVAALVDVSEGGSSRKMSQIFDRYSAIVAGYEADAAAAAAVPVARTRTIERD